MPESDLARELARIVRVAQAEQRIPSGSAAVVSDGEVEWADAVGLTDVTVERPATHDT